MLDQYKAVAYADDWTKRDKVNPQYNSYDNNCANFASQTLVAGGMPQVGYFNLWDPTNWFAKGVAGRSSHTFINSQMLNAYMYKQWGFPGMNDIWGAGYADYLFADWQGGPDGVIDHTMVVVGRANNIPLIDQKSPNRYWLPLSVSIQLARDGGNYPINWYGIVT